MRNDFYPPGTVHSMLESAFVTPQTKRVLQERLLKNERTEPHFFDEAGFNTLMVVCDCLFPQEHRQQKIPLAVLFEEAVQNGKGKGWRFDAMPPAKEAMLQGLRAIDEEAAAVYGAPFTKLHQEQKENLLTAIQEGRVQSTSWQGLPSNPFFTELLTQLNEIYYSHPLAKEEIGDVSFADEGGWKNLGLNNLEEREPQSIKKSPDAAV